MSDVLFKNNDAQVPQHFLCHVRVVTPNVTINIMATLQKQFLIHVGCYVDFFLDDCTIDCPLGRVIDEKGRELCECAEPERPKCPSMIRCQKNCVYGYKVILTVSNNSINNIFMKEKAVLPVVHYYLIEFMSV